MFGDRLKELRFKKKMTQRDLAKYLNITQSAVARYESDSGGMPSQDILIKMADLFGVSTDYLLGRDVNLSEEEAEIMCDNVKGLKVEKAIERAKKFIGMVKGEVTDPDELEDLDDAIAFESISTLPARVKCAVLSWYTLKDMLENNKEEGSFIPS